MAKIIFIIALLMAGMGTAIYIGKCIACHRFINPIKLGIMALMPFAAYLICTFLPL